MVGLQFPDLHFIGSLSRVGDLDLLGVHRVILRGGDVERL